MKVKLNCVLLIDDDEDDNFFHHKVVKEAGITEHIKIVENGFEAIEFLRQQKQVPELIFLDINMPKMNGWEFLEKLNSLSHLDRSGTIIMLTTSLNPADKEKSESIPQISDFKSKPLTAKMLSEILANHFTTPSP
jgi:CheY-like chemotaxis protein